MLRWFLLFAFLTAASCGEQADAPAPPSDFSYQETLMGQLIDAKPGDVIEIPEGTHAFNRSLSLNVDGVTIRGKGMDKSVLTFKGQLAGAEGLLVTANDFTIEDLAIEDTKGDALKISDGENIIIRRVRTEWTGGPKTSNGAYGIYPVQTKNVLMEENVRHRRRGCGPLYRSVRKRNRAQQPRGIQCSRGLRLKTQPAQMSMETLPPTTQAAFLSLTCRT